MQATDTSAFGVRVRCDDDTVTVADKAVSGRGNVVGEDDDGTVNVSDSNRMH